MDEIFDYLDFITLAPNSLGVEGNSTLFTKVQFVNNQNKRNIQLNQNDIVIVGVNETRNSSFVSNAESTIIVRKNLYALAAINVKGQIIDFGDIKATSSPAETYAALETVVNIIVQKNATLLVIGGSHDLTLPIIKGYYEFRKKMNLTVVDSHIDYAFDSVCFPSQNFLSEAINEGLISDLSVIGYQSYFTSPQVLNYFNQQYFELNRLGVLRGNIRGMEPSFRNSNVVSFDLSAVRSSDCCGCCAPSPNGLYAEEICQLSFYAGYGDAVSCFGLFGFIPENDNNSQTAILSSQVLWHFIEGVSQRTYENPSNNSGTSFKKYIVNGLTPESDLVFYKSEITGNWWMEVSNDVKSEKFIVPCSQSDYEIAANRDIPERWYRYYCRLIKK